MLFDVERLQSAQIYKLMTATVVPRPIGWVVSQDRAGRLNAAPFSFFNAMSGAPPIVCLGIGTRDGVPKDTARNIADTGDFVVNLVPKRLAQAMNLTAADFEDGVDELAAAGLATIPSSRVAVPRIAESPVALECERLQLLDLGGRRALIVGRVVALHVDDRHVLDAERCHIDTPGLDLVARMHGAWYCSPGALFEMPRVDVPKA